MYYPTLHLEIARYVQNAGLAGYDIPWAISRIIGSPPSAMCKPGVQSGPPAASKASSEHHRRPRTRPPSPAKRQPTPNTNGHRNGNGKKVTPPGLFDS